MLVYLGFIIVMAALLFWMKKSKSKKPAIIALLVLILFSGLRYRVGTDYSLYEKIYLGITEGSNLTRTGGGYKILSNIFSLVFPNTAVPLISFVAIITNLCIYRFCKKNSVNPALSIFLYIALGFYTLTFNIFRQMLSVSLVLFSYNFLKENKYVRYAILSILAVIMHKVALFAVVVIFVFEKIWKKKLNPIFLVAAGIMGLLCYGFLFQLIFVFIKSLHTYATNQSTFVPGLGTFMLLAVYGVFFVLVNLKRNALIEKNSNNLTYINIYSVSYILMLFSAKNIMFMRVSYYISIFIILLLPELYNICIENWKYKKAADVVFLIASIVYFLVFVYSFGEVVPYHTIIGEFLK